MNLQSISKWTWVTAFLAFFVVYSKKQGGYGQFLQDLENLSLEKLKTKTANIIMMIGAAIALYVISRIKAPPAVKLILNAIAFFVFGYNLFKMIDPPAGGGGGFQAKQSNYFGRNGV
jgi:hypothetical protein